MSPCNHRNFVEECGPAALAFPDMPFNATCPDCRADLVLAICANHGLTLVVYTDSPDDPETVIEETFYAHDTRPDTPPAPAPYVSLAIK